MNNIEDCYPGISKIRAVKCSNLPPNIMKKHIAGLPVQILCDSVEINTIGDVTCEISPEMLLNNQIESLKLEFKTLNVPKIFDYMIAFVIETCNGEVYIIGTREAPFPIVTRGFNTGVPGKDSSVTSVSVTLKNTKTLIPIVV